VDTEFSPETGAERYKEIDLIMDVHKKDATQRGLYTILIREEEEKGTSGDK